METDVKRCGLYPRRSKQEQSGRPSASVSEQETVGRADCATYGWTVADVYPDDGRSASRFASKDRDEWPRLRCDVDAGRLDVVWMWECDRGSREMEDWAGFLNLCRRRKVLIFVHTHERLYDPTRPRDRRSLLEDGIDAEYDSEKKSLNIRRTVSSNARNGRPHGPTTYGYERLYDPVTRELVDQRKHPEQAAVVRTIFKRLAKADPLRQIVQDLNDQQVPTPRGAPTWRSATVRSIAMNPAYIGERRHEGRINKAIWPPLVDLKTWVAVQTLLADPSRRKSRPGRNRWLLSFVASCERCSDALAGRPEHEGRPPSYGCRSGCVSGQVEWFDRLVTDVVVKRLSQKDFYEDLLARAADDSAVLAARAEAETLRQRLAEHYRESAAGRLSAFGLGEVERELLPQIEAAEARAEREGIPAPLRALLDPPGNVAARWAALSIAARKMVLRALFVRIALKPADGRRSEAAFHDRVVFEWRHAA